MMSKRKTGYMILSTNQIYIQALCLGGRYDWYGSPTNQKSSFVLKTPKKRLKQYPFSKKQKMSPWLVSSCVPWEHLKDT